MPAQVLTSVENNFTKGLITEFTGLNFPENAATDCDNVDFTIVGDVIRREGIDYEENFQLNTINRTSSAINTYKWNNVGGDGLTQLIVQQTGAILYFYKASSATIAAPLSTQKLVGTVDISTFAASGGTFDPTVECQFTDGNGYLFGFQPTCNSFYCSYTAGVVTANSITLQTRDFIGIPENVSVNLRPSTLSQEHLYNLTNQGWTAGNPYTATDTSNSNANKDFVTGSWAFTVQSGLAVTNGDIVTIGYVGANNIGVPLTAFTTVGSGTVTAYSGTTLTINVTSVINESPGHFQSVVAGGLTGGTWYISPVNHGYINTWFSDIGNYPSNADVWWYFKDNTDAFNPTATVANVSLSVGAAPQGHFLLNPFKQQRTIVSGVTGITDIITSVRPRTGTWFQGRVWYAGVDAQQSATGDEPYTTWTENIYFSQIVQASGDFGSCYQVNDPTSETLFDLLPTDGGVIVIQGSGSIYKLFPIQNGMLVFAANGIWFITGSQGIGFSANDYTITKISAVQSISGTSYVDVNGLPYFWNEEGIYSVTPSQQGGLTVEPITVGTILTFYNNIPVQSKKFARAAYHPIDYVIQWIYKTSNETSVTNRYDFDSILNFNTYNKAFFPYSLPAVTGKPHVHGINYVAGPGGTTSPDPVFKYLTASTNGSGSYNFTFSEENNTSYTDFVSYDTVGFDYNSYFVTGYKLHGGALRRFQLSYLNIYSRSDDPTSYYIQGLWDYANTGNSGRWSTAQLANIWSPNFGMVVRRHKIRGQGLVLQLKVSSLSGQPFDIMGWAAFEQQNAGV